MTEIANVFIVNLLASTRHFCIQFKGMLPPFLQILFEFCYPVWAVGFLSSDEFQVLKACPCSTVPQTSQGSVAGNPGLPAEAICPDGDRARACVVGGLGKRSRRRRG